jgi:uncharacterized membrane protein YesL
MLGLCYSLVRLRGDLMMDKSISIAVVNSFGKIIATVLIGCFAVGITALASTVIGKFLLIGISGWIAVNVFGLELSSVREVAEKTA